MLGFSKFTSLTHLTTEGVWSSRHMSRMVVMEMQFFVMLDTHYYITQGAGTGTQTNQDSIFFDLILYMMPMVILYITFVYMQAKNFTSKTQLFQARSNSG